MRLSKLLPVVMGGKKAWNPSEISSLRLWLETDDQATLFQDAALTTAAAAQDDLVGGWADQSGNGYHLTQADAKRPDLQVGLCGMNGKHTVRFDANLVNLMINATADWLSGDSTGTIVLLCQLGSLEANKIMFATSDEGATTRFIKLWSGLDGLIRISQRNADTEDLLVGDTVVGTEQTILIIVRSDNSDFFMRVNGVDQTLTAATGSNTGDWFDSVSARDNFTLGGWKTTSETGHIWMQAAALLVFGENVTGANLTLLENYMKSRYLLDFTTTTTRLGIIGDSIAARIVASGRLNFPAIVAHNYNHGNVNLLNHAVSGQSIIANMDAQVVAAASDAATIFILQLGANDNDAGDMGALQAELEENITELQGTNPAATMYYMGVLPIFSGIGDPTDKSHIRAAQAAACLATGITYWDTFTDPWIVFADTSDGTHPTQAGQVKIAARILALLP